MFLSLREIQRHPYRLGIFKEDTLLISISKEVAERFGWYGGRLEEVRLLEDSLLFKRVILEENKKIKKEFYFYLSRAERSPSQVKQWLKRRGIFDEWAEDLMREARIKNYFSKERYVDIFLEQALMRGKSRWVVKRELFSRGIEVGEEVLSAYNEMEAIRNLICKRRKKMSSSSRSDHVFSKRSLRMYLLRQGYQNALIDEALLEFTGDDVSEV